MESGFDRRQGFSLRRQLISLTPLALLWLVGIAVLLIARVQTVASLESLFLDPAFFSGLPWYTGALSNLGIIIWTSGVVFAACGAWVANRIGRTSAARFLAVGAAATLLFAFDDIFQLHSGVLRRLLGGNKDVAQLAIVLPTLVWVVVFYRDIMRTRAALLGAAFGSLGGSLLVDVIFGLGGETELLVEDGLKFLGILAWAQYFAITSRDIANSAITGVLNTKPADLADVLSEAQ